jgi:hypothetical protein
MGFFEMCHVRDERSGEGWRQCRADASRLASAAHNQQKQIGRHRIAECDECDTLSRPYIFALKRSDEFQPTPRDECDRCSKAELASVQRSQPAT